MNHVENLNSLFANMDRSCDSWQRGVLLWVAVEDPVPLWALRFFHFIIVCWEPFTRYLHFLTRLLLLIITCVEYCCVTQEGSEELSFVCLYYLFLFLL